MSLMPPMSHFSPSPPLLLSSSSSVSLLSLLFSSLSPSPCLVQEIELVEALCGFKKPVTHLDGRTLVVSSDPGQVISHGEVKVVEEAGMPTRRGYPEYGNLYILFKVKFPKPGFAGASKIKKLEALLPPRKDTPMIESDAEEVEMCDVSAEDLNNRQAHEQAKKEAYEEDEDEDEGFHHRGGGARHGVECASQ